MNNEALANLIAAAVAMGECMAMARYNPKSVYVSKHQALEIMHANGIKNPDKLFKIWEDSGEIKITNTAEVYVKNKINTASLMKSILRYRINLLEY